MADKALNALDVDSNGLDDMDIRILTVLTSQHKGRPVGLSTLAVAVNEEKGTIEEVYEPFLIQEGFIQRTPKGRTATRKALDYMGVKPQGEAGDLFNAP